MASNSQTQILTEITCDYNEKAVKHSMEDNTFEIIYDKRHDSHDGSCWRSKAKFKYGTFSARIKCPRGNTAGLISAFYLTSEEFKDRKKKPRVHDEIDFEFVGKKLRKKVETDYYVNGNNVNRNNEKNKKKRKLGFDSSCEFHKYSIEWQSDKIEWLIDGKSIRVVKESEVNPIPQQPMYLCGSFWKGTKKYPKWAGIYKGTHQPYTLIMTNIHIPEL